MASPKGSNVAAKARQAKAIEMRASGLTFRQIAKRLRVTHTQAFRDVSAGLEAMHKELAGQTAQWVALELRRLDKPTIALEKMLRNKSLDEKTKCIAIETWRKLSESRRRLLGLDQPEKREHSGPGGGPIEERVTEVIINKHVE